MSSLSWLPPESLGFVATPGLGGGSVATEPGGSWPGNVVAAKGWTGWALLKAQALQHYLEAKSLVLFLGVG